MREDETPIVGEIAEEAPPADGSAATQTKKHGFSSKLGFVLAAAGSAVGLGNLWRFPYLAAKYGGGMFLLVYIVLAVTFGFLILVLVLGELGVGFRLAGFSVALRLFDGILNLFLELGSNFLVF